MLTLRVHPLISLSFAATLLAACGQDDSDSTPPWTLGEPDAAPDLAIEDATPDVAEPLRDASPDQGAPHLSNPGVELLRYRRAMPDCDLTTCITEVQFAVRGGMIMRLQQGVITGRQPLQPEEYDTLLALVTDTTQLQHVRFGWPCEPVYDVPTYEVELGVIYFDGQRDIPLSWDVSDCAANEHEDAADALIDFGELMFLRYYAS